MWVVFGQELGSIRVSFGQDFSSNWAEFWSGLVSIWDRSEVHLDRISAVLGQDLGKIWLYLGRN